MDMIRLAPTSGKYLEVVKQGRPIGIWKISPVDGAEGTPFPYEEGLELLKKHSADLMVLPQKVNGKLVSPIKAADLEALNGALSKNRNVPANLDNSAPSAAAEATVEAQAKTIAALTEQNTTLMKNQQSLEARLAALEAAGKTTSAPTENAAAAPTAKRGLFGAKA